MFIEYQEKYLELFLNTTNSEKKRIDRLCCWYNDILHGFHSCLPALSFRQFPFLYDNGAFTLFFHALVLFKSRYVL